MDQYPAQTPNSEIEPISDQSTENPSADGPPTVPPNRKLPLIFIGIIIFIFLIIAAILFVGKSSSRNSLPTPTPRPTATPFPPPTMPVTTAVPATSSATILPAKIGRLAFIKDGDIYQSDLTTISLLVKNATPAGDRLSWSPKGNLLAWRPKSMTATPSAVTVYNRSKKSFLAVLPVKEPTGEVIDYAWSPDEEKMVVLSRDSAYKISLYSASSGKNLATLVTNTSSIRQVLWPDGNNILFADDKGIGSMHTSSSAATPLVTSANVSNMKLSPDKTRLLYSVGDNKKSDLYIINLAEGSNPVKIFPKKIDMGSTGIPNTIVENGLLAFASWFPKSDKLLIGYHYQPTLSLVGIYNIGDESFAAISLFTLSKDDLMIDDFRLLGARINQMGNTPPTWQVSLFTIEDNAKLGIIRVIPAASSPTFFSGSGW